MHDLSAFSRDAKTRNMLRERLQRQEAKRGELLVAIRDSTTVGYVFLWLEPAEEDAIRAKLPDVPLIMNLWVQYGWRHKGCGQALMRAAEDELRHRGHRHVALGVSPDNHDAIEFYEQRRYVRWAYNDVDTFLHTFADDGSVLATRPDTCTIYVKDLHVAELSCLPRRL